jgi:rhodanese-related sulfurtransferase
VPAPGTEHWDEVYRRDDLTAVSWHQREPTVSLELIESLGIDLGAAIVDAGGGDSPLALQLLDRGFTDVTVLDVAGGALAAARAALGARAADVDWVEADVRTWRRGWRFDLWHDRALFHFFVEADDRRRYVETLRLAVRPGGAVVVATFAPDGPETCSGLPVARYDAAGLALELGVDFAPVAERREEHVTPSGRIQPFTWVALRRRPPVTLDALLEGARASIERLSPAEAWAAAQDGALLVDIRSDADREHAGVVPGSLHVPRTVLEWRLAPGSAWASPHVGGIERRVVVICDHGYSSSLAAATLAELGYARAGDVVGGFEAWAASGLPVGRPTARRVPPELAGMGPPEPLSSS